MSKPLDQMSFEDIEAERADIRRQRAELSAERTSAAADDDLMAETDARITVIEQDARVRRMEEDALLNAEPQAEEDSAPEPWPHAHMVHADLELEVRIPSQSALMAISMLQQLEGLPALQMEVFNTFITNHLSPVSLGAVIKEFIRPQTEMTMQSLVQALVNLRIDAA